MAVSTDEQSRAFLYEINQLMTTIGTAQIGSDPWMRAWRTCFTAWLDPERLHEIISALEDWGELPAKYAARYHARIRECCLPGDPDTWKWTV